MVQAWFTRAPRPNWLQRLISWRQLGPWSHVRLAISCDRGWEVLEAASPGGVQQRFAAQPLPDVAEIVQMPLSYRQILLLRGWWASHIGERYDAVGLVEVAMGRPSSDKRAWFCSEAVAASLHAAGLLHWLDPAQTTPALLWAALRGYAEGWESWL